MSDNAPTRDHLFISYAWEDGALAEWLTLKLTAEGYRVWCDRFKNLGGERWPEDIDTAIKTQTHRMLHLLSRHSLHKENPSKERQLALTLSKERGEFLIPLNVDGTQPRDIPWQLTDITYIPFQNWALGLRQLLKKLVAINTPRPLADQGPRFAIDTFLPRNVLIAREDVLQSNCLKFTQVPNVVRRFLLSRPLNRDEQQALFEHWAYYSIDDERVLAFAKPQEPLPIEIKLTEAGGASWPDVSLIDSVRSTNIVSSLLKKTLLVKCFQKGLKRDEKSGVIYFPNGLLEKNRLKYQGYRGRLTRVDVAGERKAVDAKYHLGITFSIRQDVLDGFVALFKITLFLLDMNGERFDPKVALRKRKRITKSWWNHQWLSRHVAVRSFLADGGEVISVGESGGHR